MTFPDLAALKEFAGWKAARAPQSRGSESDPDGLRAAYLELLKLASATWRGRPPRRCGSTPTARCCRASWAARIAGSGPPAWTGRCTALTMAGLQRLDDLQACVEAVVRDGVEGDLIEAGTWRGGASILMRATLDALGDDRGRSGVADSFQGFPASVAARGARSRSTTCAVADRRRARQLRAPRLRARRRDSSQGFFEETLPGLAGRRWAVVRLDGDTYEATRATLRGALPGARGRRLPDRRRLRRHAPSECRRAVDEFRAAARDRRADRGGRLDLRALAARTSDAPVARAGRPAGGRTARSGTRRRVRERTVRDRCSTERASSSLEREVAALRASSRPRASWRDRGR